MRQSVMSVRGPLPAESLGYTLPHEHIYVDLSGFPGGQTHTGRDGIIKPVTHERIMLDELEAFKAVGGRSLVELTCRNLGSDIRALRRIAELTGLNIIAGCGWYRDSYIEDSVLRRSTAELAEELVHEIENGVQDTNIRPGVIGEIGTNRRHFTAKERHCLRVVAIAQQRTGLAITTHLPEPRVGYEALNILVSYGVPPERIIIGHCDYYLDLDYHAALMRRGAYVQFDQIRSVTAHLRPWTDPTQHIQELIRQGFSDHILLSHDNCCQSHLKAHGGLGYDYLSKSFFPNLKNLGCTDDVIHTITVENPTRALAV